MHSRPLRESPSSTTPRATFSSSTPFCRLTRTQASYQPQRNPILERLKADSRHQGFEQSPTHCKAIHNCDLRLHSAGPRKSAVSGAAPAWAWPYRRPVSRYLRRSRSATKATTPASKLRPVTAPLASISGTGTAYALAATARKAKLNHATRHVFILDSFLSADRTQASYQPARKPACSQNVGTAHFSR